MENLKKVIVISGFLINETTTDICNKKRCKILKKISD